MKKILLSLFILVSTTSLVFAKSERIVSVDGSVTEIIYALGEESRLVGVDTTSVYPDAVHQLPKVGYKRALSSEGILSLEPDLVFVTEQAGPPPVLKMIQETGVPMVNLEEGHTLESIYEKIDTVAKSLDVSEKGERLIRSLKEKAVLSLSDTKKEKPRVMFIFHAASGSPLVSGRNTAADAMIQYAGGENVVKDYEGYKPLNPEYMGEANPDVLLTTDMVINALGGVENFKKMPGVSLTKAVADDNIIVMDTMYLLGFSPRTPNAIKDLSAKINQ